MAIEKTLSNCSGCGVKPGELHDSGCDVEQCSGCGGQRIFCGCGREHDPIFARWTGIWPGKAESEHLGLDLNEFEKYRTVFFIKPCEDYFECESCGKRFPAEEGSENYMEHRDSHVEETRKYLEKRREEKQND